MIRMKTLSIPKFQLNPKLRVYPKITQKILLKLNQPPNLKLKLKRISTPELNMNIKNVMKNLGRK